MPEVFKMKLQRLAFVSSLLSPFWLQLQVRYSCQRCSRVLPFQLQVVQYSRCFCSNCLQDLRRKSFDNWSRKWGAGCRSSVFLHLQKAINFQESIILVALLQCCSANQDAIHMHVAKITFYLSALRKCVSVNHLFSLFTVAIKMPF